MNIRYRSIKALTLTALLAFSVSCMLDVPLKEMTTAKTAIESAREVNADRYSPEELQKAEKMLIQSHAYLADGKADEAKKAANTAIEAAGQAEKKSLPIYSADNLKKAEDAYAEADRVYASKFSAEKFTKAGTLKTDAKSSNDKGDYRQSISLSGEALTLAIQAREESIKNSVLIDKEIGDLTNTLEELKKDKFSSSATDNLARAGSLLDKARSDAGDKNLKAASEGAAAAKTELNTATGIIKKKSMTASIESLRQEINRRKTKKSSDTVTADLDNAVVELNAAETSIEQNNLTDAGMRIEQAEKLVKDSDIKAKKNNALAAIAKSAKLLEDTRPKDTTGKYKDNLDKADNLISSAKASVESQKYDEAISAAEEAETVITAVINSIETSAKEMAVKAAAKEEKKEEVAKKDETVKEDEGEDETEETTGDGKEVAETKDKADADKEKAEKETAPKHYVVIWKKKKTDCLWRIAGQFYNDPTYWPAIYLANKDQIKDPDLIFPGQKLIIPPKPEKRPDYKIKKSPRKTGKKKSK